MNHQKLLPMMGAEMGKMEKTHSSIEYVILPLY